MTASMQIVRLALLLAMFAPAVMSLLVALSVLLRARKPTERTTTAALAVGLLVSLASSIVVAALSLASRGAGVPGEVGYGSWLRVGTYEVPAVFLVDSVAVAFSLLAAALTTLVARFSRTYLHKEPGFVRFYVLLGLFASGVQLVAWAGALDVMFAGWELVGISSALFIGFFHERNEPVRSSVRAFATYRLCDAGFLLGVVAVHELLGSTRLAALSAAHTLDPAEVSAVAALFLLSALGKSAQLPFSGWLPRAMEGPTPSSALFYGGISIHAGVYLLLRVWPVLDVAPVVEVLGVVLGLGTAVYATLVARTHTDAKGTLAHATLAQVGLILAEISAGLTDLALLHLVGHALLRVWQYLRAPNAIHDAHRVGHSHVAPSWFTRRAPILATRLYAAALHRFRVDERLDGAVAPVLAATRLLERAEGRYRALLTLETRAPTKKTRQER